MKKQIATYSITLFLALGSVSSADDGIQFFLGGSAGLSYTENNVSGTTGNTDFDEIDNGYKIFGGVQFNDYIGLEMHFANLGGLGISGNSGDGYTTKNGNRYTFSNDNTSISTETYSTGIAPVFGVDVTDWFRPYVKAGYHYWKMDASVSVGNASAELTADGFDPFFGVGIDFNLYEGLNIRTEYEHYILDEGSIDYVSGGMFFKF